MRWRTASKYPLNIRNTDRRWKVRLKRSPGAHRAALLPQEPHCRRTAAADPRNLGDWQAGVRAAGLGGPVLRVSRACLTQSDLLAPGRVPHGSRADQRQGLLTGHWQEDPNGDGQPGAPFLVAQGRLLGFHGFTEPLPRQAALSGSQSTPWHERASKPAVWFGFVAWLKRIESLSGGIGWMPGSRVLWPCDGIVMGPAVARALFVIVRSAAVAFLHISHALPARQQPLCSCPDITNHTNHTRRTPVDALFQPQKQN